MPDIPYYQAYLNATRGGPVDVREQAAQTKQASAGSDSPALGDAAAQEPSRGQREQARPDDKRAEVPTNAPAGRLTAPLPLSQRPFLNQGGMLGKEGREALGGAPTSSSSAPSSKPIPNFSRKLPTQPQSPTR